MNLHHALAKTAVAATAAAAAAAAVAGCAGGSGGASTGTPRPPAAATSSAYDAAGFLQAATGPEQQRFTTILGEMSDAATSADVTDTEHHARQLDRAASDWLNALADTSPPPRFSATKQHLINGITLIQKSANEIIIGAETLDADLISQAANDIVTGGDEISNATADLPAS